MYSFDYFEKYMMYKKRYALCEFELKKAICAGNKILAQKIEEEISEIFAQMTEIKKIIDNYQPGEHKNYMLERLFLRCRYVDGMTMEQTAELMDISRNTVYRIKKKIEQQMSS